MFNKIKSYYKAKKQRDFYARLGVNAFLRDPIEVADASGGAGVIVTLSKRIGLRFGDITSKDFEEPEFDLLEIDSAYETDSYVRQGCDKYIEQIFKEEFRFYGNNESAVEYVNSRLLFIAEASGITTQQLLVAIAEDLVKYSNVFLLKARKQDETQIPPTTNVTGLDGAEPIVAYFPAHPGTMKLKRDKTGLVQGFQQEVDGADKPVKFKTQDVVHMFYKKKKGNAFGTPFLLSVLNDVKALRFLEENVVNMLYKHVNPFIHVAVGDKDSPGTKAEVEEVENALNDMDPDDGFVSSNRVALNSVGTNNAVDARPYLDYFEQRVFSGIGVPGVAFGRGGTSNRNTADAMTSEMSDRIKAYQKTIEQFFNSCIVKELLQEGGFDPLANPDDMVSLQFMENDLDKKVKFENHHTFLFEHNVITEVELRESIGRDPIVDRGLLYHELYTMPLVDAKASQSAGDSKGTSKKETTNKNKPTNQHGTKPNSKKTTNELSKALTSKDYRFLNERYSLSKDQASLIIDILMASGSKSDEFLEKRFLNLVNKITLKGDI